MQASHSEGAEILPQIDVLLPSSNFKDIIISSSEYQGYRCTHAFYVSTSRIIKSSLLLPRTTQLAPATNCILINALTDSNADGYITFS